MKRGAALRKLNNKKKKLTPEEMVDIGIKANDYVVWRKVIEKINWKKITDDRERVIDLFFQSKSDYFRNMSGSIIKNIYAKKGKKSEVTV